MPTHFAEIEQMPSRMLRNALEIINISNSNIDQYVLCGRILDAFFEIVYADSSIFFPAGENEKVTAPIQKNLSRKHTTDYINHFHELDPFRATYGTPCKKTVVRLEELVDFHSFLNSEYYNDFYKPQNIYHKLVISLQAKDRLYGEICMHRPSTARNFTKNEIRMLRTVTPYFVHALAHHELRQEMRFKDGLLDLIDDNASTGIIILDDSLRVLHINKQGRAFCKDLFGNPSNQDMGSPLPEILAEDCRKIKGDRRENADIGVLPRNRILQINESKKYNLTSRLIDKEFREENREFFMISIEKTKDSRSVKTDAMKEEYHLTHREAEVAAQVFKGLKNAEIARKLFVSEITVKWHIRNIFEKVGAKSRAALIHKLFFRASSRFK